MDTGLVHCVVFLFMPKLLLVPSLMTDRDGCEQLA